LSISAPQAVVLYFFNLYMEISGEPTLLTDQYITENQNWLKRLPFSVKQWLLVSFFSLLVCSLPFGSFQFAHLVLDFLKVWWVF